MAYFAKDRNEKLHGLHILQDEINRMFERGLNVDTSTSVQEIEQERFNKMAERYMRIDNCKMTVKG